MMRPVRCAMLVLYALGLPVAPGPAAAEEATPLWQVPFEQLTYSRDRPLFSRTRRPPPVAVALPPPVVMPVVPQPAPPPQFSLMGILLGPDNLGVAILRDDTSQELKRLHSGESLAGWTLVDIQRRDVTLERAAQKITLRLPVLKPEPGAPASLATEPQPGPPTRLPRILPPAIPVIPCCH